jgi:hypothetical protein
MYKNLKAKGFGGFDNNAYYWSSSDFNNYLAWIQSFDDGRQASDYKNHTGSVRAVRAF